jgi:hypothetical protein
VIKVFSGDWRGLGEKDRGLFLMMDFRFRDILHLFHGPKLAIFFCIVFHADKEGRAWPGYELMQKETGYNKSTISAALQELCQMEIEGQRVLLRYRVKDERGRFDGSYRYIIFPRDEEISEYEKPASPKKKEDPEISKPNIGITNIGSNIGFTNIGFTNIGKSTLKY